MNWLPRAACAILLIPLASCGNGQAPPVAPEPIEPDSGTRPHSASQHDGAPATEEAGTEDPWAGEVEHPVGVDPLDPAAFITFIGFEHGQTMKQVDRLLPARDSQLGERTEIDMAGSMGYKYEGHFAAAWDARSKRIEFLSVRSQEAMSHIFAKGREDDKLKLVWGITPAAAHGLLGPPTQVVNRPHAVTYRYEFVDGDRRGTVSLEFSKLATPVRCSAVSVHWFY